jgi:branched-chain amino acid aminotransferase
VQSDPGKKRADAESAQKAGPPQIRADWIWADGEFVRWEDATIHIMSHVAHYGSSVFEGVRAYGTPRGPAFFRLEDHMRRLLASARIHRMEVAWTVDQLCDASADLVRRNQLSACYLRPLVFRGVGAMGLDPTSCPTQVWMMAWDWAAYLGADAAEQGIDAGVSSWQRPAPNTHPTMAKAGGNYVNASLMKMEAKRNGFDEAIALSVDGTVSEGSGQNLFVVRGSVVHTPAVDGSFLQGITRDSILTLARDLGFTVREGRIPREALYVADEVFFAGTATEVVPVRSVDGQPIGHGGPGPVTCAIRDRFGSLLRGLSDDPHGWLTHVD